MKRLLWPSRSFAPWYLRRVVPKRYYIKTSPTVNRIIRDVTKKVQSNPEVPEIVRRINETGGNLTVVELLELKQKDYNTTSLKDLKSETVLNNLIVNIGNRILQNTDLQVYLITELNSLISTDKKIFKSILTTLCTKKSLTKSLQQKVTTLRTKGLDEQSLQYTYFRVLILLCISFHNPILASTMLLQNTKFTIQPSLVKQVFDALLQKNPKQEEYDLDLILKLTDKFKLKCTEFQASQIMTKLQSCDNIILTKKIQQYLLSHTAFVSKNAKINSYYGLILKDFKMKNAAGVMINWKAIIDEYDNILKHDIRIIAILIQSFNESKKYIKISTDIVSQLPTEYYSNPLLTSHLIKYCAKMGDVKLANAIIQQLEAPLSREILSDLLRLNLVLKDMEGMEKILNQILTVYKTLNAKENEIIVTGLLKQGKIQEAVIFADGLTADLGKSSFLAIINHFVTTKGKNLSPENLLIVDKLVSKVAASSKPDDTFWVMLGSIYIKYLTRFPTHEDLKTARVIYENSVKNFINVFYRAPLKNSKISRTTIDPFNCRYREGIILRITQRSRIIVVKTILDQAIKIKHASTLKWCINELFELGMSPLAIKIDISRKMSGILPQIGISKNESTRQFVQMWESASIKLVQRNKTLKKLSK